jgi:hypothetical protein
MKRHSIIRADHVEYGFWLVFGADGGVRSTRATPTLGRTERAMFMTAKLPTSLFRAPDLRGSITIAEPEGGQPTINIDAAAEALKGALGVDIDLRIGTPE